jgi:alkanesulfonate monooxygenase SsuD/methylene tetrahydromethanopterin reductase-like flavin-dependent oxidoreductase (luciferase family)
MPESKSPTEKFMQLGYFMMPLHHVDRVYHETLEEDMEAIIYADQLGYSEAWVGEHYSSAVEQITSPLMFHANLIARTKQIKLATGVMCLPQYHPAVTAGQAAMFDHLSNGRFIMGVGPGGLSSDFELFGILDKDRMEMMEEALDAMLELWATEPPYDIHGKHWDIAIKEWTHHDIKLGYVPKPLQQPHPPIAISAMSPGSGSLTFAGKRGYMPVSANFIANWSLKTHWPTYCAGAQESGLAADPEQWHVARSIYVDETDSAAADFVKLPGGSLDYYYEYLHTIFDRSNYKGPFVANAGDDPETLTHEQVRDACVIHGSAKTVARKLLELREEIGHFGTLLYAAHDWVDKARMKNSMRLMAEEVMPIVNRSLGVKAA